MSMRRPLLLFAACALVGCLSAEEQRLEDACGGTRPESDSCETGLNWADCGGSEAEPRFGCSESDCRWFAGGCVPRGYRASDCPSGDLCCVEHGDGALTPFATVTEDGDMVLTNDVVELDDGRPMELRL